MKKQPSCEGCGATDYECNYFVGYTEYTCNYCKTQYSSEINMEDIGAFREEQRERAKKEVKKLKKSSVVDDYIKELDAAGQWSMKERMTPRRNDPKRNHSDEFDEVIRRLCNTGFETKKTPKHFRRDL